MQKSWGELQNLKENNNLKMQQIRELWLIYSEISKSLQGNKKIQRFQHKKELVMVFEYLDFQTLFKLRLVNRQISIIVKDYYEKLKQRILNQIKQEQQVIYSFNSTQESKDFYLCILKIYFYAGQCEKVFSKPHKYQRQLNYKIKQEPIVTLYTQNMINNAKCKNSKKLNLYPGESNYRIQLEKAIQMQDFPLYVKEMQRQQCLKQYERMIIIINKYL